jgi:Uma2 family endonuclease
MSVETCQAPAAIENQQVDHQDAGRQVLAPLPRDEWPNVDHLVTEDDTPVDNIFSEKQQRLLTETLYTSWEGPGEERPFLALANVGLFYAVDVPPLVPDMLLSLDVQAPQDIWEKSNRSYFVWKYGKPPDVVVEVVSNTKGDEAGDKFEEYARIGVRYYVIFDPSLQLKDTVLRLYELRGLKYVGVPEGLLPGIGLRLHLWTGMYADMHTAWLRWCDPQGNLLATGAEQRQRAERLARRLRELGVNPDLDE